MSCTWATCPPCRAWRRSRVGGSSPRGHGYAPPLGWKAMRVDGLEVPTYQAAEAETMLGDAPLGSFESFKIDALSSASEAPCWHFDADQVGGAGEMSCFPGFPPLFSLKSMIFGVARSPFSR